MISNGMMKKLSPLIMQIAFMASAASAVDYAVVLKHPHFIAGSATQPAGTPFAVLVGIISDTSGHNFVGRCRIGNSATLAGDNHFHWQDSTAWQAAARNSWGNDGASYYNTRHVAAGDSGETTKVWFVSKCDTLPGPQYLIARMRRLIDTTATGSNRDSPSRQLTVMNMSTAGGWLKGHVYADAGYAEPLCNFAVLAYRSDSIVGSHFSEPNGVNEGYAEADSGFVKFAVPAGRIDSLKVRTLGDDPVNFHVKSTAPWTALAGDTIDIDILPNVPTIVWTSPANNAANVSRTAPIRIGFNKTVKQSSFAYACSTDAGGWSVSWNARSDTATLTHAPFSYNTRYKFTVTAARDSNDNDLVPGPKPNPFRFTTQPDPASLPLVIVVLDVGQGDATIVKSPAGKLLLFDGGPSNSVGTAIGNFIIDSLQSHHVDYTVASHYHDDHIGGLDMAVSRLGGRDSVLVAGYDRGSTYSSGAFTEYRDTVGAKRQTIALNQVIDLGAGAAAKCVAVNGQTQGDGVTPSDENDYGVALLFSYGGFKMVQAGDLGGYNAGGYKDVESLLAPDIDSVTVLHVNHHGSRYSTNPYWLSVLKPKVSVISVGANGYGHVDPLAMDRLMATSTYVYLTEAGSGDTVDTGRGRIVGGNIWIRVWSDSFTVAGTRYSLPTLAVSLSSFAAMNENGQVVLRWRTESEEGCYQWLIERSDARNGAYRSIGSLPGNGTTSDPHAYAFVDNTLDQAGVYWYRLAEIDLLGAAAYHGPVSIVYNPQGIAAFAAGPAYPNPAAERSSIDYQLPLPGRVELAVYNVLGQRVRTLADGDRPAGAHTVAWDGRDGGGSRVAGGVYLYRLEYRDAAGALGRQAAVRRLVLAR